MVVRKSHSRLESQIGWRSDTLEGSVDAVKKLLEAQIPILEKSVVAVVRKLEAQIPNRLIK